MQFLPQTLPIKNERLNLSIHVFLIFNTYVLMAKVSVKGAAIFSVAECVFVNSGFSVEPFDTLRENCCQNICIKRNVFLVLGK